jgi:hypothetical protein
MSISKLTNQFLDSLFSKTKTVAQKLNSTIDVVNAITDGGSSFDTISETTAAAGVTIDGALIKDGAFTGKQATATATADGLTTGLLTGADQFVTVTSASADNIVALPAIAGCPLGTKIRGWVGSNGFELRVAAAEATATKINNVTTNVEAAVPATSLE